MKKSFILKSMSGVIIACAIATFNPLAASAKWSKNSNNNTWQYTNNNNKATGWENISNKWYYFDNSGTMKTGWQKVNSKWYYLDNSGDMKTGWLLDGNNWYYLNSNGEMNNTSIKFNGKTYKFNNSGAMIEEENTNNDTTIDEVIEDEVDTTTDTTVEVDTDTDDKTDDDIDVAEEDTTETSNEEDTTNDNSGNSDVNVSGLAELPNNYSVTTLSSAEDTILKLMNEKRTQAGLEPLTMDNTLREVARYKSNHMIQYNYFSHTNPDGTKWINWLNTINYNYSATAENIAYNTYDAVELFNQWWNSAGHKANMMNASYTKVGIGVLNGDGKYMGTQTFSN